MTEKLLEKIGAVFEELGRATSDGDVKKLHPSTMKDKDINLVLEAPKIN